MKVGDILIAINNKPLEGNDIAPPLMLDREYLLISITYDSQSNPHFDVGLKSHYNYIKSWDTKEDLLNGRNIHWCHPSRFKLKDAN